MHQFLSILFGVSFIFMAYIALKNNPESLSKKALSSSFSKMGWLALILIGFVYFLLQTLPQGDALDSTKSKTEASPGYRTV